MSDPAIAGYGVVDGPPLPLSPNGTVLANLSGGTAYPIPTTLAALAVALGSPSYQGTWNASTNTPTLASGVGVGGGYYVVSVAGTTTLDGISDWTVGDWAIFNATLSVWEKIEGGATTLTAGSTLVGGGTANGLLWRSAGVLAVGAATLVGGTALAGLATLAVAGALATGAVLTALGGVNIGASASAAAWTTSGIGLVQNAASYTDTSSSGTVAAAHTNLFGASTVLASSATTYTKYYGTYFTAPVASTNVTFTNRSALGADTISIGGAAQGTNALAVTGTGSFSGTVSPSTNGGTGLGTTALAWGTSYIQNIYSDGSLNLGGNNAGYWRIVGANGNFTNVGSGAQTIGLSTGTGTSDVVLSRGGAANWQLGNAAVDTAPVAQTLSVQNTLAGGTSNVAGAAFTIAGSQGKGTGVGGSLIFQVAPAGSTGTVVNALATALTIDSTKQATFSPVGTSSPVVIGSTATTFGAISFNNTLVSANMNGFAGGGDTNLYVKYASGSLLKFNAAGSDVGQINSAGAMQMVTYQSGAPAGSSAGLWKLGALQTGLTLSANLTQAVYIDIGGVVYKLLTGT